MLNNSQPKRRLKRCSLLLAMVAASGSAVPLVADEIPRNAKPQLIPPATEGAHATLPRLESPMPSQLPYKVVAAPNTKLKFVTMAIKPTSRPTVSNAIALARFVWIPMGTDVRKKRRQLGIFVFNDNKASKVFAGYQRRRQGRPLQATDFKALKSVWPKALVYYESDGNKEWMIHPYKKPNSWWQVKKR